MKTKLFILGIMACFTFISCQKDPLLYSCDPEMDAWAKNNYESIQSFTIAEFIGLDYAQQQAAYATMGQKQRHEIWMNKLNDVIQMCWTEDEEKHIELLISYVGKNESLFANNETQQERDQFELSMYEWVDYAEEKLKWDKKTIYSICGDPNPVVMMTVDDGRIKLINSKLVESLTGEQQATIKTRSEVSEGPLCSCAMTCDLCDIAGEANIMCNNYNYKCQVSVNQCGWFKKFDCDGVCKHSLA
jgi:hypothetical protein